MSLDTPEPSREELEVRLTALLLGELPTDEAAALQQAIEQDPELSRLHQRLKQTIGLVREAAASPTEPATAQAAPLKLSNERRKKLLAQFKTVTPKEFTPPRRLKTQWFVPMNAAAALVTMIGVALLATVRRERSSVTPLSGRPSQVDGVMAGEADLKLPQILAYEPLSEQADSKKLAEHGAERGLVRQRGSDHDFSFHTDFARQKVLGVEDAEGNKPASPAKPPSLAQNYSIVLPSGSGSADKQPAVMQTNASWLYDDVGSAGAFGDGGARGAGTAASNGRDLEAPITAGFGVELSEKAVPAIRSGDETVALGNRNGAVPHISGPTLNTALAPEPAAALGATIEPETLRGLEAKRIEAQAEHQKTTDLYQKLAGSSRSESRKALGTASLDPQLTELLQQMSDSERKLSEQTETFSADSPDAKQTRKELDQINQKVDDRLDGILAGLEVRKSLSKQNMDRLEVELDKAKKRDIETAIKRRPYFQAKRDLEDLQIVRDRVSERIIQEKVDAAIPKSGIVRIVDRAEAQPDSTPTLGERIKGALTGSVERSARIAVEKNPGMVPGLDFDQRAPSGFDPYWIQTEFETVQSKPVLEKVIEKLNLNDAWAKKPGSGEKLKTEETLQLLKKRLNVSQDPKSSLIDIRVKSEKPEEAARIANTIAEVYRDSRLSPQKQMADDGLRLLQEELGKQEKKLASARAELEDFQSETESQPPDVTPAKPAAPAAIPQPEVQTRDNAFSTFSLNVSDVSFKLAAASLEKGVMPEPATVRSEEFINAFDYRDPEPPPGVPIGFTWERARYPFAHNRNLLRFSVKTAAAGRHPGRPLNLVLLLDNSGSMERADRVLIIREALRVLATQLQPQDKMSVVTFARTARLWADGLPGNQAGQVAEQVSDLTPQGGTNLEDAMNLAYQTALRHYLANGVNRVVLLTDGAANLGNVQPDALKLKVEAHRKQGIALDCFGVGWEGFNDDLLEVLSRNGDGRYGFINTPEDAATEFAGQLAGALKVAASDVKVQVEFNPARVTAYRQIGYAKHQLTKEQFRDNTVDAAEIGAAESGNALYVAEVNPRGEGPLATVRVRFKVPGTGDYREHEWAVPYAGNAGALEQASPAMRLAATASAFSEWLVSSPYAAEVSPDRLLGYLSGVPDVYGADARPKKLEWMIRQARSLSRK